MEDNVYENPVSLKIKTRQVGRQAHAPTPVGSGINQSAYEVPMKLPGKNEDEKEHGPAKAGGCNNQKKIAMIAVAVVALIFFVVIAAMQAFAIWRNSSSPAPSREAAECETASDGTATSCLDWKNKGKIEDNFYRIRSTSDNETYPVYCDMTTDGGGWTLVASIHETNIRAKCDSDDLWSTYLARNRMEFAAEGNWLNSMTFGDVRRATMMDYKNAAFYSSNASDIMLWHIRNDIRIEDSKPYAKLRYRTNNNFLKTYGGNLARLLTDHYPLKVLTEEEYFNAGKSRLNKVLDILVAESDSIKDQIPNWHEYQYSDSLTNRIALEGYQYGNSIHYYGSSCSTYYIQYGSDYNCGNEEFISSRKSSPFFFAAVIGGEDGGLHTYSRTSVYSYSYTAISVEYQEGDLMIGNFRLQYLVAQKIQQISTNSTPVFCEMHFLISNEKDWRSSLLAGSFVFNQKSHTWNRAYISGEHVNVVMGYVLLSRGNGTLVTEDQLDHVAQIILQAFTKEIDLFNPDYMLKRNHLSVSVTFDAGDEDSVLRMTPPNLRGQVSPGSIQFRPYNFRGYPNALCPGISAKTSWFHPEYVCIGGFAENDEEYSECGDFAGWEGNEEDDISLKEPVGSAHAMEDISSTILIFYR